MITQICKRNCAACGKCHQAASEYQNAMFNIVSRQYSNDSRIASYDPSNNKPSYAKDLVYDLSKNNSYGLTNKGIGYDPAKTAPNPFSPSSNITYLNKSTKASNYNLSNVYNPKGSVSFGLGKMVNGKYAVSISSSKGKSSGSTGSTSSGGK